MFVYQNKGSNGVAANGMRLFATFEQVCEYIVRQELAKTFTKLPNGPNAWFVERAKEWSVYHKMSTTDVWLKQTLYHVRVTLLLPGELAPPAKLLNRNVVWDKIVELKLNEFYKTQILGWIESKTP